MFASDCIQIRGWLLALKGKAAQATSDLSLCANALAGSSLLCLREWIKARQLVVLQVMCFASQTCAI